jgi:hypothetical protein
MGNITWTKSWSSSDNGTVFGGADVQNIQSDITSVVNGNITNANVNASAAIAESKVAFDNSAGHGHNGTDSKRITMKHYIAGGKITRVDTNNITVGPTTIDIGGTQLISVAASSNIDVGGANYITPSGGAAGSEPADGPVYVLAYNNSGTLAFKLCDVAPTLSYNDDTTAEYPLRYIKDSSSVYYRYIGVIHNRSDLVTDSVTYVDQYYACGSFTSDNANEVITTLWTPWKVNTYQILDATPADGEDILKFEAFHFGFDTAAPHIQDLNIVHCNVGATDSHELEDEDVAGAITAITDQAASTAGSFTVFAPTDTVAVYWEAWGRQGGG